MWIIYISSYPLFLLNISKPFFRWWVSHLFVYNDVFLDPIDVPKLFRWLLQPRHPSLRCHASKIHSLQSWGSNLQPWRLTCPKDHGTLKNWLFWGPYTCYAGSNPSIGGSKILRVEHYHGGLVQIMFLSKWVICRFQPFIFQGEIFVRSAAGLMKNSPSTPERS